MFLGTPFEHENESVSSTLYQWSKYLSLLILVEVSFSHKSFIEAESHLDEIKYYLNNYVMREKMIDEMIRTKCDDLMEKKVEVVIEKSLH